MGIGLKIGLDEVEGKLVLRLDGRIDAATAPLLDKKLSSLIHEGKKKLLLDFSRVDYLSSAGLRTLLSATKSQASQKGFLVLFGLDEDVLEIIQMAGFEKVLHIREEEKDALQFHL